MRPALQRVAAIHDLSGFGGGSLSAAIPILSSMGLQVCTLPTALLSTHTGGFQDFHFRDLTEDMRAIMQHWQRLQLQFAGIYSGFLGSAAQIALVHEFINTFSAPEALVVIDPVLGDDGVLYETMTTEMVHQMRSLLSQADVITPNCTEMALLLGLDPATKPAASELKTHIRKLANLGPRAVIVTSVPEKDTHITAAIAFDAQTGRFWKVVCPYVPACYPGTGDIFASVVTGALLQGDSLPLALDRAVQFVSLAIRATFGYSLPEREGVLLERVLPSLHAPVALSSYEVF